MKDQTIDRTSFTLDVSAITDDQEVLNGLTGMQPDLRNQLVEGYSPPLAKFEEYLEKDKERPLPRDKKEELLMMLEAHIKRCVHDEADYAELLNNAEKIVLKAKAMEKEVKAAEQRKNYAVAEAKAAEKEVVKAERIVKEKEASKATKAEIAVAKADAVKKRERATERAAVAEKASITFAGLKKVESNATIISHYAYMDQAIKNDRPKVEIAEELSARFEGQFIKDFAFRHAIEVKDNKGNVISSNINKEILSSINYKNKKGELVPVYDKEKGVYNKETLSPEEQHIFESKLVERTGASLEQLQYIKARYNQRSLMAMPTALGVANEFGTKDNVLADRDDPRQETWIVKLDSEQKPSLQRLQVKATTYNTEYELNEDGSKYIDDYGNASPTGGKVAYANTVTEVDLTSLAGNHKQQRSPLPFPTQIVPESFSVQILDNPGNKPYPLPKCLEHRTLEYRQQQALKEVIDFTVDNTNLKGVELIKAIQHNVAERLSDQTKKEELLKDEALSQSIKQYLEEKQTSYLKKLSNYIMAKYNGISVKKYKQQQITNLRHKMVKHHGLWASREKLGKPSMSERSKGR